MPQYDMRGLGTMSAIGLALCVLLLWLTPDTSTSTPPPAPQITVPDRPACTTDEPGPNPCFWDASERGNGKGHDFFTDGNGDVWRRWDRPLDGHDGCWVNIGDTSYVWCTDGYMTTS